MNQATLHLARDKESRQAEKVARKIALRCSTDPERID